LKAGEIMIAPITDVGWTPYFSFISGLVTELGGTFRCSLLVLCVGCYCHT